MATRAQPRPAPEYDWDNDGGASRQGSGIYILNPGIEAQVKKPSWYGTETIFRPYPCVSFTNPATEFESYRLIQGERNRFSDWIRRYNCAWMVGNPATTFLIKKATKVYDPWTSPLGMLYRAVENACKKGHPLTAEWQPLRESSAGKGKQLRGPSECYLMQGALLKHDKTEFVGKDGPPLGWGKRSTLVMMLSFDTGRTLVDMLNQEKEGYKGPGTDFEARYVHGDPVSPLFGRYIHFWERGSNAGGHYKSAPTKIGSAFDEPVDGEVGEGGKASGGAVIPKGYEVEIANVLGDRPASLNKVGEEQIRQHWQHWDDMLYFPTEIEQAHMLFRCYPPSACLYAFEGVNKDWIPADARQQVARAVSASVPGTVPGQGGFKPPPPPDMEGWGSAPDAAAVQTAERAPWDEAPAAVDDVTVPQGMVDDPAVPLAPPAPAMPPAKPVATALTKEEIDKRTAAAVLRLAGARNKIQ